MRASGQQKTGAVVTFLAYWTLGIPLTMFLVFYNDMGIFGIWVGPTLACAFNTVAYILIFKRMDWHELIRKSAENREKDKFKKLQMMAA
jgi:Na+-driven multidrug efflux pump